MENISHEWQAVTFCKELSLIFFHFTYPYSLMKTFTSMWYGCLFQGVLKKWMAVKTRCDLAGLCFSRAPDTNIIDTKRDERVGRPQIFEYINARNHDKLSDAHSLNIRCLLWRPDKFRDHNRFTHENKTTLASVRLTADDVVIWTREREKKIISPKHFKMRVLYQRSFGCTDCDGAFPNGERKRERERESTNPSGCDIMHQLFFRSSPLGWIGNFEQKTTLSLSIYALSDALHLEQDLYFKSNVSARGRLSTLTSHQKRIPFLIYTCVCECKYFTKRLVCISKTRLLVPFLILSAAVGLFWREIMTKMSGTFK